MVAIKILRNAPCQTPLGILYAATCQEARWRMTSGVASARLRMASGRSHPANGNILWMSYDRGKGIRRGAFLATLLNLGQKTKSSRFGARIWQKCSNIFFMRSRQDTR